MIFISNYSFFRIVTLIVLHIFHRKKFWNCLYSKSLFFLIVTSSLKLLTESDLTILEEIVECPQCLSGENICKSHAEEVKAILIKNTKNKIDKLTIENID